MTGGLVQRLLRFGAVGLAAALVDLGGMQALIVLGLPALAARAVSLPLAMLVAWQLNRRFTFAASRRAAAVEGARYMLVAAAAALTNYLVFAAAMSAIPIMWHVLAAIVSTSVSMWVSFLGFQRFAFAAKALPLQSR